MILCVTYFDVSRDKLGNEMLLVPSGGMGFSWNKPKQPAVAESNALGGGGGSSVTSSASFSNPSKSGNDYASRLSSTQSMSGQSNQWKNRQNLSETPSRLSMDSNKG